MSSIDMYKMTVGQESAQIHEANRRPKGRHPLFCFICFIVIGSPLTATHPSDTRKRTALIHAHERASERRLGR